MFSRTKNLAVACIAVAMPIVEKAKSKTAALAAVGTAGAVSLAGSDASAGTTPDSLVVWTTVTDNIKDGLSDPATQAVYIGGLILAAVLGWMLIKRFAR